MAALKCNPAHLYSVVIFYIFWSFGTAGFNILFGNRDAQPGARRREGCHICYYLSWTDSIKPGLLFSNFGCCISKGSPFRLLDSEVLITTGKALITFCVDSFYKVFWLAIVFFGKNDFPWFLFFPCKKPILYFWHKQKYISTNFENVCCIFWPGQTILLNVVMQIIIKSMKTGCNVSRVTKKPTIWHVRPAKTPISLGIRPVWSESSLSPWRNIKSLATHWAHSEDSDQTRHSPSLIRVFAGRTLVILLVLSCCGSCVKRSKTCFITSLGEEGSGLCASRAYVCLFCTG